MKSKKITNYFSVHYPLNPSEKEDKENLTETIQK